MKRGPVDAVPAKTRAGRGGARRAGRNGAGGGNGRGEGQRLRAAAARLARALERAFGMAPEDAFVVAEIVARCFEGRDEVNDEALDAEVRSLFYTLEARRILSFRREEYDNDDGVRRRAFWWRVRPEVVAELGAACAQGGEDDVYASLPPECWRRATAEAPASG